MLFFRTLTSRDEEAEYIGLLAMIGSLSGLFSESDKPYLASRIAENLFCRCLRAENLSRSDVTADARKGTIGIGIKTWVDSNLQKIAEFNALRPTYINSPDLMMLRQIAEYRNERIAMTMRTYGLSDMVYHCLVRNVGTIDIFECPMQYIDVNRIYITNRKDNIIAFTDGFNEYSFNISKSTLYKRFDNMTNFAKIQVRMLQDPFAVLAQSLGYMTTIGSNYYSLRGLTLIAEAVLPLYSVRGGNKWVPPKNNLNMRFAGGRPRDLYEVGIPIPADFRHRYPHFFPGRDISFRLLLPDGRFLFAKQCQDDGKALMSNPNAALGHWLIDDVLRIPPDEAITYEDLAKYGIDAVRLEKVLDNNTEEVYYTIDFALAGSYEEFMGMGGDLLE